MSVAAIATSSAGLITSGAPAHLGHPVTSVDKDPHGLEALKQRRCPVYAADLQEITRADSGTA